MNFSIHGDLSFSNIILTNDHLYFIDLIDHYLGENILADISKLLFDIDFSLSLRTEQNLNEPSLSSKSLLFDLKSNLFFIVFVLVWVGLFLNQEG